MRGSWPSMGSQILLCLKCSLQAFAQKQFHCSVKNKRWKPTGKVATVVVRVASEGLRNASRGVALELVVAAGL